MVWLLLYQSIARFKHKRPFVPSLTDVKISLIHKKGSIPNLGHGWWLWGLKNVTNRLCLELCNSDVNQVEKELEATQYDTILLESIGFSISTYRSGAAANWTAPEVAYLILSRLLLSRTQTYLESVETSVFSVVKTFQIIGSMYWMATNFSAKAWMPLCKCKK